MGSNLTAECERAKGRLGTLPGRNLEPEADVPLGFSPQPPTLHGTAAPGRNHPGSAQGVQALINKALEETLPFPGRLLRGIRLLLPRHR